ncbi:serine hydrolase domain-containing protein [Rhodohalobacter sp. 8-1]|uniref:serine hydrolase domain-containing protein n=1 Tax=Rhodohalobacter sp. 8-1 TaxID=3131972 RepID=UPI0030EF1055
MKNQHPHIKAISSFKILMGSSKTFLCITLLFSFISVSSHEVNATALVGQQADTLSVDNRDSIEADTTGQINYQELSEFIDGIVAAQRREHQLSALAVSVLHNDSLFFSSGYGLADIESERPAEADQTLFRIGSVSKTYTWTAVMILVERGLLDLDRNVNEYLSEVQIEEAFDEPVTMRHLMSHRAGFEDSIQLFAVADDDPRTRSQLLSDHQPKRVFPPGVRTSYSNWGAALAAQIVEDVAEVPFEVLLREDILDPLGLENTITDLPAEMNENDNVNLATGYKPDRGALDIQNYLQLGAYWPAGGMAATAADMARWMQFHLNGGELDGVRLLSSSTHEQMWTRAFNDRPNGADVAHGFQDRPYRGVRMIGHSGGTAAFLTNMIMVPELNLGIFLSQNSAESSSAIFHLPELIIDQIRGYTYQPLLVKESTGDELEDMAGTYLNNRRVLSTFAAVMGLSSSVTLSTVSDSAIVLSGLGESTYYRRWEGREDIFEDAAGNRLSVIQDDLGNVAALADGSGVHSMERVGFMNNPNTFFGSFGLVLLLTLTTLLGAWRRFGHSQNHGLSSRIAGFTSFLASVSILTLVVAAAILVTSLSGFDISQMPENYPSSSMYFTHYAGWFVAVMSLIMLIGLWPVWSSSGLKLFRRLHYSLYAVALFFFVIQLWQWRVIGAEVI